MDSSEAGARGKGRAVSSTARAGCGRGRDGRGCGEWRKRHGGATATPPPGATEVSGDVPAGRGAPRGPGAPRPTPTARSSTGQESAVFLIRQMAGFRTPQSPDWSSGFEIHAIRAFRTTQGSGSSPLAMDPSPGCHGSLTGVPRIRGGSPTSSRRCRELLDSSRVVQR